MRRINPEAPLTEQERNQRFYQNHKDEELRRNRKYHQDNKEKVNLRKRNYRHKITQEQFEQMLTDQNNRCAICREVFNGTPHVDHDHLCCDKLRSCDDCRRSLLCEDCNLGLGRFKDSVSLLQNAMDYILKWKAGQANG